MIYKNQNFNVTFSKDIFLPGYVIIEPNRKVYSLADFTIEEQIAFGGTVSIVQQIIKDIIAPERIYLLTFCELKPELHFHIFPRIRELGEQYKAIHNVEKIAGPLLFDWALKEYNNKKFPGYDNLTTKLKEAFAKL